MKAAKPRTKKKKSKKKRAKKTPERRSAGGQAAPLAPGTDFSWKTIPDEPTELVIGLVGPLGTSWENICDLLENRLKTYGYETETIHISRDLIPKMAGKEIKGSKFERAHAKIELGNELRRATKNNAVLALAAASEIGKRRKSPGRNAYIVRSVKHPDEIATLRQVYAQSFFLFGVHTSKSRRFDNLAKTGERMTTEEAERLIKRDEHEDERHGQHTRDAFHMADFFLTHDGNEDKTRNSIWRCLDLIFGKPTITPTFNEFAMFMAFASSLRSADLSRQIGAVVARDKEIIATGANDCPRFGGGLYWPIYDEETSKIKDVPDGRDCERGHDRNHAERERIIQEIAAAADKSEDIEFIERLREGSVGDITEYGRSVHAEMEAICSCARTGVSCVGATLFTTTFPCHNCAKHIVAAGILKVIYVEPYPKSKADQLHDDTITFEREEASEKVRFQPFIGVGPRRFFDLFSMHLSAGRDVERKCKDGKVASWDESGALPRIPLLPVSYLQLEQAASNFVEELQSSREND